MSLIKASAVSLGVAFALHVFVMAVAPYGLYTDYERPKTTSAEKACQSMLILACLSYAFAFLLAMTRAFGDSAAASAAKLLKVCSAALAVAGVLFFLVGIIIAGVKKFEGVGLVSYHVTIYTLAAVFALYGGIVALVADSEQGYTREP